MPVKGFTKRMRAVAGNFFISIPPAELYLLEAVLHYWNDKSCIKLLNNCRYAMSSGGCVTVIEYMLGDIGDPGIVPLMDLNMMVLSRGRERNFAEYRALFEAAGFERVQAYFLPTDMSVVVLEAFAA